MHRAFCLLASGNSTTFKYLLNNDSIHCNFFYSNKLKGHNVPSRSLSEDPSESKEEDWPAKSDPRPFDDWPRPLGHGLGEKLFQSHKNYARNECSSECLPAMVCLFFNQVFLVSQVEKVAPIVFTWTKKVGT